MHGPAAQVQANRCKALVHARGGHLPSALDRAHARLNARELRLQAGHLGIDAGQALRKLAAGIQSFQQRHDAVQSCSRAAGVPCCSQPF